MTPLEIEIIVHYYCKAADYRDGDFSAPAVADALEKFCGLGLLKRPGRDGAQYDIAPRGMAYLRYLCIVPLPEPSWAMPEPWPGKLPPEAAAAFEACR